MEQPARINNDINFDTTKILDLLKKTTGYAKAVLNRQTVETNPPNKETLTKLKKTKEFIIKHPTFCCLALLIILQFIPNYGIFPWGGIHLRLQADDLLLAESAAERITYNKYLPQIYTAIKDQQPDLPDSNINQLAHQQLDTIFKTDQNIQREQQAIATLVRQQYTYTDKGGVYTYLPDIDSYYYLRLARNIYTKGQIGDTIKEGIPWDEHATAPLGSNLSINLHPYTLATIHTIINTLKPNTPIMQSTSYFPIITTIITIIILFFIGKTLSNNLGGIITATIFSLNHFAITKTAFGMIDTDAYNLMFPTVFMFFFISMLTTKQTLRRILYVIISSTILALYAFTWAGWWHVLYISIATSIGLILFLMRGHTPRTKIVNIVLNTIFFITISSILVSYVISYHEYATLEFTKGFKSYKSLIMGPFSFSKINAASRMDLWPNVYTTVAELQATDINRLINSSGGPLFTLLALIGIFMLIRKTELASTQFVYGLFLTITILAGVYAALKGQRFILLLIVPLSISASHALMLIQKKIGEMTGTKIISTVLLLIMLFIITNNQIAQTNLWLKNTVPDMNYAWWNALTQIKENSQKDAIITSWWDFGHQFAYISDRAVTFDGGSQNTPMAHWVGKMLSTNNEQEAIGILRMLACGSNKAYDILTEKYNYNLFEAHEILNNLFPINKKEEAKKYLESIQNTVLNDTVKVQQKIENTEDILQYTHCNPPENYLITSEDMRKKGGVWSHFGNWDFKKAYIWQTLKNKPEEEAINIMTKNLSYTKEDARELYDTPIRLSEEEANYWIGPAWTYSTPRACASKEIQLICGGFISFNTETKEALIKYNNGETKTAKSVAFVDEKTERFTVKTNNNTDTTLSAIIFQDGTGTYYGLATSKQLTDSMFTRLMYFDAHGLKHFKPFAKEKQINGGFVSVWKIDWNGTTPNIAPTYQHKEFVTNTSTVTFNILSYIQDGEVIDSTITNWKNKKITPSTSFDENPTEPRTRTLGTKQVIPMLEQTMINMKQGQTKTIQIPANELFSADNELLQKIGNKTINFKIRMERIR